jgi:hypothetical protein
MASQQSQAVPSIIVSPVEPNNILSLAIADDNDFLGLRIENDLAIIGVIINSTITTICVWGELHYNKQPYHTSALSSVGWVDELLSGHPRCIKCELGVSIHVFKGLIHTLQKMGYTDSQGVTLREQLAIFVHACVTALTIHHLGERFQQSNAVISK